MYFKYMKKRLLAGCLILALCLGTLTGCGSNVRVVFTTGLSGDQIFKLGSMTCTRPELMVYLTTFYHQYADSYGPEMWHYDFGGVSLEDHVKDVVLSRMEQIKIMNLMAKEREITLSESEEEALLAAAEAYYGKLGETLVEKEKMTERVVEKVYREYAIANKVYRTITESAEMEISDDEARTVQAQVIHFRNWSLQNGERTALSDTQLSGVLKEAKSVLTRVRAGEDFETVALSASDDSQILKSYDREHTDEAVEELLFSMDVGQISDLVETEDGYYIFKCVSTMDYEATQANKLVLAEKRRKEAFSRAYEEIAMNTHFQLREKQWQKLSLDEEIHWCEADFFEIYHEYVKQ